MQAKITLPAHQVPAHLQKYFKPHLCGQCYVCHMVEVFRDVWRVLRDDGTVWLNLGDSYSQNGKWGGASGGKNYTSALGNLPRRRQSFSEGLEAKQLIGIPWRVAFALQADGWWLRSAIVWAKGLSFCPTYSGSVMPESCKDRPTSAYEMVFLLSKRKRYFYDGDAVREQNADPARINYTAGPCRMQGEDFRNASGDNHRGTLHDSTRYVGTGRNLRNVFAIDDPRDPWSMFTDWLARKMCNEDTDAYTALIREFLAEQDQLKDVFVVNPASFKGSHFATFPPALVEPCIKAGTSEKGVCAECGAPFERVVERHSELIQDRNVDSFAAEQQISKGKSRAGTFVPHIVVTGWRPTCDCPPHEPVPAVVLDMFGGAGTAGLVANYLGRDAILIELNPDYAQMAQERITDAPVIETQVNGEAVEMQQATMFETVTVS